MSEHASFGRRFVARIVDGILIAGGMIALMALTSGVAAVAAATATSEDTALAALVVAALAVSFLGPVLAVVLMAGITGSSPGQRVVGIRLADESTGQPIGAWRAVGRHLFSSFVSGPLFCLGFLAMLWSPKKQTWHDAVARSLVVRDTKGPLQPEERSHAASQPEPSPTWAAPNTPPSADGESLPVDLNALPVAAAASPATRGRRRRWPRALAGLVSLGLLVAGTLVVTDQFIKLDAKVSLLEEQAAVHDEEIATIYNEYMYDVHDWTVTVHEDLLDVEECLDAMLEHFRGFGGIVVVGGSLHVADSIRCSSFGER